MTWPFENDTSAIVKKLANRDLKADKTRNILIVTSIAFAACLIMAVTWYAVGTQRASRDHAAGFIRPISTVLMMKRPVPSGMTAGSWRGSAI